MPKSFACGKLACGKLTVCMCLMIKGNTAWCKISVFFVYLINAEVMSSTIINIYSL